MISRLMILLLTFMAAVSGLHAQNAQDERVLFTVEGTPITVGEFVYIYAKTNGDKANFSRASLEEYLDLYVRFKLKVQAAGGALSRHLRKDKSGRSFVDRVVAVELSRSRSAKERDGA